MQTLFSHLREILEPRAIHIGVNAFPAAKLTNVDIESKAFQRNADLLCRDELAAHSVFHLTDEALYFFTPSFSLSAFV